MTSRRQFIKQSLFSAAALSIMPSFTELNASGLEISLAEWSLHRTLHNGTMDHLDFPSIARNKFRIGAVEYVNGFFGGKKKNLQLRSV